MDTLRTAPGMSRSHPRQRSYIDVDTSVPGFGTTPMQGALSLLRAILEATSDGILVVDLQGMILCFNRRFLEMWRIPDHVVSLREDATSMVFVLDQLQDSDGFVTKVHELYAQPLAESVDVLKFKDGRIFERYSRPQCIGEKPVARVWSFRDITDHTRAGRSYERLR
ncbi:MAG: PAS-domain containing protein [Pseudonocardiaceae bacterium]